MKNDICPKVISVVQDDILTPENIKLQFEYQRIDERLYHKACHYLERIKQEELHIGSTTDELELCKRIINFVIPKIPDHFKRQGHEKPQHEKGHQDINESQGQGNCLAPDPSNHS